MGVPLLVRLPRGVRLTAAGASFLVDARAILARTQQAAVRARGESGPARHPAPGLGAVHHPLGAARLFAPGARGRAGRAYRVTRDDHLAAAAGPAQRRDRPGFARPGTGGMPLETVATIDDPYCLALPVGNPLASSRAPVALKRAAHEQFVSFARYQVADYFDRTRSAPARRPVSAPTSATRPGSSSTCWRWWPTAGWSVAIVPASFSTLPVGDVVFRPLDQRPFRLDITRPAARNLPD